MTGRWRRPTCWDSACTAPHHRKRKMSAAGKTLLVRNVELLATMDGARRELRNAGLFARGNAIEWVGPMDEAPATADTEIDLSQHLLLPGLVNTHHHMYQSLTRAV